LQGFLQRLHRAYNGDLKYFADPDEWAWYQEWVQPFHDPLGTEYRTGELGGTRPYTEVPEDYFSNLRYYIENEAPGEWFEWSDDEGASWNGGWEWNPYTPDNVFHSAINKKVI